VWSTTCFAAAEKPLRSRRSPPTFIVEARGMTTAWKPPSSSARLDRVAALWHAASRRFQPDPTKPANDLGDDKMGE
jgi:hypothetical protein